MLKMCGRLIKWLELSSEPHKALSIELNGGVPGIDSCKVIFFIYFFFLLVLVVSDIFMPFAKKSGGVVEKRMKKITAGTSV